MVSELSDLLRAGGAVVLTGAGMSTDSGIPDYRGPEGTLRRRTPMSYQSFLHDPVARRRYWARSHLGWPRMAVARPNAGHRAVARLQAAGCVDGVITQNVDGLHQAAGSTGVIELHGGLDRVVCLNCHRRLPRTELDRLLRAANPDFDAQVLTINPDGDAEVPDAELDSFRVVPCPSCGGVLKPDVVFFGESVPRARVDRAYELVDNGSSLIVLGSSLTVYSGYRFAVRASKRGIPLAIVNRGTTRADRLADIKIDAPLRTVLPEL